MEMLCVIRDIQRALSVYEQDFYNAYSITLNEAMLLCCLSNEEMKATDLATTIALTCSNCSKVIKLAEDKGFIQRSIGKEDKRQMFFSLTIKGSDQLKYIQQHPINIPDIIKKLIQLT